MVNEETFALLQHLRSAEKPVSGAALARALGVSRVALWKRFESLRAAGYPVAADRSGYRLLPSDKPLPWEFPGDEANTLHFDTLESTMDEAFRQGLEGRSVAVVAERQSAGRGRSNRKWESGGGDLLVTLVLRPDLPLAYTGALGLEALVCLAETLADLYGLELTLKWPNDLMAAERKVAGVLVEACGAADRPRFYTVGLGLNVHGLPNLDRPVTSLDALAPIHADRRAILAQWRRRLSTWAEAPLPSPSRWEAWAHATTPPRPITVETFDGRVRRGHPLGFDLAGGLRLAGDEHNQPIRYGEVRRAEGAVL